MRKTLLSVLIPATLLASGCGRGPEGAVIDEEERRIGREQHDLVLSQLGGAYGGPEAAYLSRLGNDLAASAGLEGECTFTLVNSSVVNAFAVPGCYIYLTRGLMAIVNTEAEFASVLGHELGHIAEDHIERQEERTFLRQLGVLAIALITNSETLTRIAGSAAEFFTLRYSRAHEYEADDFAIEILARSGYDPGATADMLDSLARHERFQQGGGPEMYAMPEWGRTHPLTENRIERVASAVEEAAENPDSLAEREAAFLEEVDGLLYGDDPQQGFVLGRQFAHPEMRIAFEVPPGFSLTNTSAAVLIDGPGGLQGEFSGAPMPAGGLDDYVRRFVTQVFGTEPDLSGAETAVVNGLPTILLPIDLRTPEGVVQAVLAAYAGTDGSAYHFLVLATDGQPLPQGAAEMFRSLRVLSPREAARLRPRVIDVVRVGERDNAASLAATMASDRPLEHFLMLNDLPEGASLQPGELVKVIRFARAAE